MLAFDTETELMRPALLAPPLSCITHSDGERAELIHHADPAAKRCAIWLLEQETALANPSFDLGVLWAYFPDLRDLIWDAVMAGRIHDVQMRQKLLDLGAGVYRLVYRRLPGEDKTTLLTYTLSDIHARYYKVRMEKDEWRLRYGDLRKLPLEQWPQGARSYALNDAIVTARIYDLQEQQKQSNPKHNLWNEIAQVQAHFALHLMSCWGFKTDLRAVEKVLSNIEKEMPALIERLRRENLVRPRGKKEHVRNEKLAKQMMYKAIGDAAELTKTGYKRVKAKEMTKDEALRAGYIKIDQEWCEVSGYQALIDYYHFRQNQLLRTKLQRIREAARYGLPIQTSFDPLMGTGRTSSSEHKLISNSMALQNPPRKGGMRSCFIARPGCTLIAADYHQAELVSLSQVTYALCGYSRMRDLINAGKDLHVDFAKEIVVIERGTAMSYEDAFALHKKKDPYIKERRNLAKGFNFGKPGGLGAASFQSYVRKGWGVEITFEQSRTLGFAWLDHFEEMRPYFRWISDMVESGNGRADIQQYMTGRWRGRCFYTQGCNSLFQGLTADAAKAALVEVSRRCYTVQSSALYGCRPVLFVHDEIIVEAPREQAHEAAKELEHVMVEVYQRFTPDVRVNASAHLMDAWHKDAEAVYDERGKMIPWNPPQDEDERFEEVKAAA